MSIDGRGMFLTCKYAIEAMAKTGGGSIVCLSSISGMAGQARQSTYGPAKFVATGIVKHLAVEWAARGIRVNGVAPGTIRTERVMSLVDEPGGAEYVEAIERLHPIGRLGDPAEVADLVVSVVSNGYLTSQVIALDGGMHPA
jgi:NAD(P)-dependent dehydrogenase (short-subunit alcohol dehydrogenase family)